LSSIAADGTPFRQHDGHLSAGLDDAMLEVERVRVAERLTDDAMDHGTIVGMD
jgi:hypothetical protein